MPPMAASTPQQQQGRQLLQHRECKIANASTGEIKYESKLRRLHGQVHDVGKTAASRGGGAMRTGNQ